jgi:methylmalonyl-CoA/ethylmalonyl-CoA epimerase
MRLHHVGIVVDDIERHGTRYAEQLGLRPLSAIVTDPIQRVQVQFWGDGREVSLELIQPLDDDSPVSRFLEKGGGLNHLCFEVEDIVAAVEQVRAKGAICVSGPVPAAAFDGQRIAFLFFRDIGLVEFVEASP